MALFYSQFNDIRLSNVENLENPIPLGTDTNNYSNYLTPTNSLKQAWKVLSTHCINTLYPTLYSFPANQAGQQNPPSNQQPGLGPRDKGAGSTN